LDDKDAEVFLQCFETDVRGEGKASSLKNVWG